MNDLLTEAVRAHGGDATTSVHTPGNAAPIGGWAGRVRRRRGPRRLVRWYQACWPVAALRVRERWAATLRLFPQISYECQRCVRLRVVS